MRDMATGRARGFGFVEMATDEEAQKAIDQLHDHNFGGRNLTVNEAKPMPARSGGGGSAAAAVAAVAVVGAASRGGKRTGRHRCEMPPSIAHPSSLILNPSIPIPHPES